MSILCDAHVDAVTASDARGPRRRRTAAATNVGEKKKPSAPAGPQLVERAIVRSNILLRRRAPRRKVVESNCELESANFHRCARCTCGMKRKKRTAARRRVRPERGATIAAPAKTSGLMPRSISLSGTSISKPQPASSRRDSLFSYGLDPRALRTSGGAGGGRRFFCSARFRSSGTPHNLQRPLPRNPRRRRRTQSRRRKR